MSRAVLTCLLSLACSIHAAPAGPIEDGRARIERYEYAAAREALEPAIDDPVHAGEALILVARSYNGTENYEQGIEYGKRAVAALPTSSEAYLQYAVALRNRLAQVGKTRGLFLLSGYKNALQKALELDPGNLDAREEELGFLMHAPAIAGGSMSKARERAAELKRLDWLRGTRVTAEIRERESDFAGAEALWSAALKKHPGDAESHLKLGLGYQREGRYREAEPHFLALSRKKDLRFLLWGYYGLGSSKVQGGYEPRAAVKHLRKYLVKLRDVFPDLPSRSRSYELLGRAYVQLDKPGDARTAYRRAIELDGDNKAAQEALAELPAG